MKNIYLLSASDRYNYGDMLFPIIACNFFNSKDEFKLHNVATVKSNLNKVGALPTLSYKTLLNTDDIEKGSLLLVAGGEVLGANWSKLVSFLNPWYYSIYTKLHGRRLEDLAKSYFGADTSSFPFTPSTRNLLDKANLVYHAVGGYFPKDSKYYKEIKSSFDAAQYVSVRELKTQNMLKSRYQVNATLVPDTAISISDIFLKKTLARPLQEEYILFQFGYQKSYDHLKVILQQMRDIYFKHEYKIALISIGNCPGHDDIKSAKWLAKNADFPITLLPCSSINHITRALCHAHLFVGTSLHGMIVSMSYGNPFIGVGRHIKKVDAYTKTWAPNPLKGNIDFSDIAKKVSSIISSQVDLSDSVCAQKNLVRDSFEKIYKITQ